MTSMSRLLLSLAAVAACATANAAPFDSADQARRDRNREEVMAKHAMSSTSADASYRVEEKKTLKSETKRAVVATENFGHRSADRMREFGARTNAKFKSGSTPAKDVYNHGPQYDRHAGRPTPAAQSSTTHVGAWSLGFSRPRTARSTPAARSAAARRRVEQQVVDAQAGVARASGCGSSPRRCRSARPGAARGSRRSSPARAGVR